LQSLYTCCAYRNKKLYFLFWSYYSFILLKLIIIFQLKILEIWTYLLKILDIWTCQYQQGKNEFAEIFKNLAWYESESNFVGLIM